MPSFESGNRLTTLPQGGWINLKGVIIMLKRCCECKKPIRRGSLCSECREKLRRKEKEVKMSPEERCRYELWLEQ